MTDIKNRLEIIKKSIEQAKVEAQRLDEQVHLLAVSKTWPAETLRLAAQVGQISFGENYLQEALIKIKSLADLNLEWHFIGPIQSNKTKDIAQHFDWVQSVDRLKIAQRLNAQRPPELPPLQICIQINIDNEKTKSGIKAHELFYFSQQLIQLERLSLRGLMIIPSKAEGVDAKQDSFNRAADLFKELKQEYPTTDTLSMGMTADMANAISSGSTMVRIGMGLFGRRHIPVKR